MKFKKDEYIATMTKLVVKKFQPWVEILVENNNKKKKHCAGN